MEEEKQVITFKDLSLWVKVGIIGGIVSFFSFLFYFFVGMVSAL
jgi:hypothetical protein